MFFLLDNLKFSFDPLAVFFLATILIVSIPALIFSAGYMKMHFSPQRVLVGNLLAAGFIFSMVLVVSSANILLFLFSWELMSLLSYFLVVFEYEHEGAVKAGTIYLVMTHIGTAFIVSGFLLLYRYSGSFELNVIRAVASSLPVGLKNIIFILLLTGFGVKAGIVPLHIWLPYAHPQAPSHISAILSGVMIKTAVYGIIRFIIGILGAQEFWWGASLLIFAAVTSLVGVIYALMENDIKRLLAYSSVENMGIVLIGIGTGILFLQAELPVLACIAFAAGLYHLLNHAVFKGLLFLCARSVYSATGTRNLEKLGGLIKRMPWTSIFFLIGAMAICALPPLNGFVSEWLIFQSLFAGIKEGVVSGKLLLGGMVASLALTSGLAAAVFVKAFGIGFLGMPRSSRAKDAKEVSLSMRIGMGILALFTVVLGVSASFIWKSILNISAYACGIESIVLGQKMQGSRAALYLPGNSVSLNVPLLAFTLLFIILFLFLGVFIYRNKAYRVKGRTWDCGYYNLDARAQYSATAFSKPFRIAFDFFLMPYSKTEKVRESYYHVKQFRYETNTKQIFKQYLYDPVVKVIIKIAQKTKLLQMGSIHWYLGYIFITLIGLIIFAVSN